MSYESRVYIANISGNYANYAEVIASVNMCAMGYGFRKLFTEELTARTWMIDADEELTEDKYGDKVKIADISVVIDWLREEVQHDDYRRLKPLLAFLEAFEPERWKRLVVIHYGY